MSRRKAKGSGPKESRDDDLSEVVDDGHAALERGDGSEARRCHALACQRDGQNRDVGLLEIDILEFEGADEEALMAAEELRARFPEDPVTTFRLATLLLDVFDGDDEALEHLSLVDKRLGENPDPDLHIEVLITLADCLGALGRGREAVLVTERLLSMAPDTPDAILCHATHAWLSGQTVSAQKSVDALLSAGNVTAEAVFLKARILSSLGEFAASDAAFQRATELDPEVCPAPLVFEQIYWDSLLAELPEERPHLRNALAKSSVTFLTHVEAQDDDTISPTELMTRTSDGGCLCLRETSLWRSMTKHH